jgi:hypothetical protein
MNILCYIFFILSIHSSDLYLIENHNKKICANCKFFIENKKECCKFGDVNIITGKHNYESATTVRNDEDKCGKDAIFFKKNHLKFVTLPYYFILDNRILLFYFSSYVVYTTFLIKVFVFN